MGRAVRALRAPESTNWTGPGCCLPPLRLVPRRRLPVGESRLPEGQEKRAVGSGGRSLVPCVTSGDMGGPHAPRGKREGDAHGVALRLTGLPIVPGAGDCPRSPWPPIRRRMALILGEQARRFIT